jgi:predicted DNA-binding antitoxin AbrB/MazE fold protein
MTIDIDATYRDGALHPESPLNLPENTPVRVRVVAKPDVFPPIPFPTKREEIIAIRPKSPRITPEEFKALVEKYSVSVGSLPVDFSREDIYSDHD